MGKTDSGDLGFPLDEVLGFAPGAGGGLQEGAPLLNLDRLVASDVPKILVVEPDRDRLAALKHALVEAGYEVTGTESSSFALTMLEYDRPDLIVSRAQLDDMDGFEFCSTIRSDPKTRDIRFLLLANGTGPAAGVAAKAGVSMVLAGSFNVADVVRNVQRLL